MYDPRVRTGSSHCRIDQLTESVAASYYSELTEMYL
jgi:hypothetical protein